MFGALGEVRRDGLHDAEHVPRHACSLSPAPRGRCRRSPRTASPPLPGPAPRRTDVPWVATVLTAGFAIVFLLIGDPVWLIAAANFTYLIGICLPSVAVWLLRRDAPDTERPYRAPRGTIVLGVRCRLRLGRQRTPRLRAVRPSRQLFSASLWPTLVPLFTRGASWRIAAELGLRGLRPYAAHQADRRHAAGARARRSRLHHCSQQTSWSRQRPRSGAGGHFCCGCDADDQRRHRIAGHDRPFGRPSQRRRQTARLGHAARLLARDGRRSVRATSTPPMRPSTSTPVIVRSRDELGTWPKASTRCRRKCARPRLGSTVHGRACAPHEPSLLVQMRSCRTKSRSSVG